MSTSLQFRARLRARSFVALWVALTLAATLTIASIDGIHVLNPVGATVLGLTAAFGCLFGYLLTRFTPVLVSRIGPEGITASTLYGFPVPLGWASIEAADTLRLPVWSVLNDIVFLRAGKVVYLAARAHADEAGFRRALDAYAPADHPLRRFHLGSDRG